MAAPPRLAAPPPPIVSDPVEELEGPPTQIAGAPEPPLVGGFGGPALAAGFAGPALEPLDELPGESTLLLEGERHTEPDLPYEPTMPAITAPGLDVEDRVSAPPRDLVVEPTVVVDPSALRAPTYRVDVRSGVVQLAPDEPPPPRPKSRMGLVVGLAAVGILVVGGAGAGAALFFWPSTENASTEAGEPSPPGDAVRPSAPDPVGPADPPPVATPTDPAPSRPDEQSPQAAGDAADDVADDADDDDDVGAGEVVPREQLEGFDAQIPRLSPRARRVPESERSRQAGRFRATAMRHYRAGEHAAAEAAFRQALEQIPYDVAAIQGLARSCARQGRLPEALAWARLAARRSPRSGTAQRVLGDVWRQAGHPTEAARAYRRGLAQDPSDRTLRQRLRSVTGE